MTAERIEPWTFLKAPTIEVMQRGDGKWNWLLVDRPSVNEPAVILFDTHPWPTAHHALSDCDRVMQGWNRRAGF